MAKDDTSTTSRRQFIQGTACVAAVAASTGPLVARSSTTEPATEPATPEAAATAKAPEGKPSTKSQRHSFAGLDPKKVAEQYRSRQMDQLSDRRIAQQVGAIVSQPIHGMSSFTLHAPLELLARQGLLPLVDPADRELARMQMVASGAAYQAGVKPLPVIKSRPEFASFRAASEAFETVFEQGDEDGLESVVMRMARQFGLASLVQALTPRLLPTLTAASHSHIGLWLLLRHGASGDPRDASLLRPAARMLARDPEGHLSSFDGMNLGSGKPLARTPQQIEDEILAKLANPTKGGKRPRGGIRSLMETAESTGQIEPMFADLVRHDLDSRQIDAAFRATLRITAHAMLQDDPGNAKFGWSHCLTLPQAACGLSSLNMNRRLGLATTLVWTTAYRSILSDRPIDMSYVPKPFAGSLQEALQEGTEAAAGRFWHAEPNEIDDIYRLLASEAAVRNDQHLAKYTRACFDMCGFDPTHRHLYLASAAKLCALWIAETPRNKITERFLDGRSTPT